MFTLTVSQLNRYIKAKLEEDSKLQGIFLKGEISNFTNHYRSGHLYFSLKDKDASVRAVMFRGQAQHLKFMPEDGMAVLVQANVGVYERDGVYQLYVIDIIPDGAGAQAMAIRQLKEKLANLGWFDEKYKKPLPPYPRNIGVITSATGAVLGDITNVLSRRYPLAKVLFCPALVQGSEAAKSLITALETLDNLDCDVIILGRGGGSQEDLWCFHDEALARAVFMAKTPVISAVGHEGDYTICDLVADRRAPTPSAAAELATPSTDDLREQLWEYSLRLRQQAQQDIGWRRNHLRQLAESPAMRSPLHQIRLKKEKLDFYKKSLYNNKRIYLLHKRQQVSAKAELLRSLSPLRVLSRGYSITMAEGKAISSAKGLSVGDRLKSRLHDGQVVSVVEEIALEGLDS